MGRGRRRKLRSWRVCTDMSVGLLIADCHEPTREGLRAAFASTRIEVVGEAATPEETLQLVADSTSVEVLLLDVEWRRRSINDGVGLLRSVLDLRADLPTLMYSAYSWTQIIDTCRRVGARGYLVKGVDDRLLPEAVRVVHDGDGLWADQRAHWSV